MVPDFGNLRSPLILQPDGFPNDDGNHQHAPKGKSDCQVLRSPGPPTEYNTPLNPKIHPKTHPESSPDTKIRKTKKRERERIGIFLFKKIVGFGRGFGVHFGVQRGLVFCRGPRRLQAK